MEDFDRRHLETLLKDEDSLRLSCYIPTVRAGRETRQNGIRFRNAMREAEQALLAHGMDKRTSVSIIGRIVDRIEAETNDERFWDRQRDGLAIFASVEDCLLLSCAIDFPPSVTVASRYCVVPLLPLLNRDRQFMVLAISRHAVRVVCATRQRAEEVELSPAVPRSLLDVVGTDFEDQGLQHHWTTDTGSVFHGQGAGEDDVLPELELYCRRLGSALAKELAPFELPIVLAGDTWLTSLFRRTVKRPPVLDHGIDGNHDRTPVDQLRALAWPIIAERLAAEDAELVRLFHERRGENRASDDPAEIRAAALQGRVDQLLLAREAANSPVSGNSEPRADDGGPPGAEAPLNADVVATLRHGGAARLLEAREMPTRGPLAAIFRY